MDEITKYIADSVEKSEVKLVNKLFVYLHEQNYDTESLRLDIKSYGNVNKTLFGKEIPKLIQNFITTQSSM